MPVSSSIEGRWVGSRSPIGRTDVLWWVFECEAVAEGLRTLSVAASWAVAWADARARVNRLGRYPVATTDWEYKPVDEGIFSRFWYGDGDVSPGAIRERAEALPPAAGLARPFVDGAEAYYAREWEGIVDLHLSRTRRRVGEAPEPSEVPALELRPDHVALERWLLDREQAHAPLLDAEFGRHLEWFEPEQCSLLFLPTPNGYEVPAYLSFNGAQGPPGHGGLIAILRSWHERFGAELVASWGTMLQLTVARPPTRLDDAFELAVEQWKVAPSTLHLPGVSIRDHARALVGRTEWFLHDRP